jgi:lysophospholipase L1-like esterase
LRAASLIRRSAALRCTLRIALLFCSVEGSLALAARISVGLGLGGSVTGAVVCVGDSNTHGMGAPPGRSYPDQLRELLAAEGRPHRVLNLGVIGMPSELVVARLEAALENGVPDCVVFLAGQNDFRQRDRLLGADAGRALPAETRSGLRRLRTVRLLETAWRVATGDVDRAEFGAAVEPWLEIERMPANERAAAHARARDGSAADLFPWIAFEWAREEAGEARADFERLLARPDFAPHRGDFTLPVECYRFELALLCGEAAPPPDVHAPELADHYSGFAAAYAALAAGRLDDAALRFAALPGADAKTWRGAYLRVHAAWVDLMRRDWTAARARLDAALADLEALGRPRPAELHALAGATLARLFGDPEFTLAAEPAARREQRDQLLRDDGHADGRAWLLAVEWIDAQKRGDRDALAALARRAEPLLRAVAAATPLRWLAEHPDADFEQVRASVALPPPRAAWLGVKGSFFRDMDVSELTRLTTPAFQRLAELARRDGFALVVSTYLDYEKPVPNDRLRAFARTEGFPLVDLEAVYSVEELGADGKRRYFSSDRSHPDEAGYGLMARALLPVVHDLLARRR